MEKIDFITKEQFDNLYNEAVRGYNNAFATYSHFKVGACLLTKDNKYIIGSNIENASYGLSNCAERTAMFKAYSEGYRKDDLVCLMVIGSTNNPISPCGACRQVMSELMDMEAYVILTNLKKDVKVFKVKDLIPYTFTEGNLNE